MKKISNTFDGNLYELYTTAGEIDTITLNGNEVPFEYVGWDDVCDEYHYNIIKPDGIIEGIIVDLDDNGDIEYFYTIQIAEAV